MTLCAEQAQSNRGLTLAEMIELVEEATELAHKRGVPTSEVVFTRVRTGLKAQLRRVEVYIP